MNEKNVMSIVDAGDHFIEKFFKQNASIKTEVERSVEEKKPSLKGFFIFCQTLSRVTNFFKAETRLKKQISRATNQEIRFSRTSNKDFSIKEIDDAHQRLAIKLNFNKIDNQDVMGKFSANHEMISAISEHKDHIGTNVSVGFDLSDTKNNILKKKYNAKAVNCEHLFEATQKYDQARGTKFTEYVL